MISVLLATYNDEKYIKSAIESVLSQTYADFEFLIGFNGTIDKSKEIASSFVDGRIKIFDYGMEKGKSKTLNRLLKESSGSHVAIQDGDDVWMKRKLEFQVKHLNEYDVVGTYINYINSFDDITGAPILVSSHEDILSKFSVSDNNIANTSAIVCKKKLQQVGAWNETITGIEDFDLWIKLMNAGCKFYNVPKVLVWHRLHSESNFNTKTWDFNNITKLKLNG